MLRKALLLCLGLLALTVVWLWLAVTAPAQVRTRPLLSSNRQALDLSRPASPRGVQAPLKVFPETGLPHPARGPSAGQQPDGRLDPHPWSPGTAGAAPWTWGAGAQPTLPGPRPYGPALAGLSASPVITFNLTYRSVSGYTDPNSIVHLVLWDGAVRAGQARTRSDAMGYFSAELMAAGRWAEVEPGHTLDVVVNGSTTTLAVPALTGTVDPAADTVSGSLGGVTLPADLLVDYWSNRLTVATTAAGEYTADLTGLVDVSWWQYATVSYQDANGNWLAASFYPRDGMTLDPTSDEVLGFSDPGTTVIVTLNHGGNLSHRSATTDPRTGWWSVPFEEISAGDVVTAQVGGGEIVATVSALAASFDLRNDLVTGVGPADAQVSVYSYQREKLRWWYACRVVPTDSSGSYTADFSAEGLDPWNSSRVLHHTTARADTLIYAPPPLANVDWTWNEVAGYAQPGATITARLSDGGVPLEELTTMADSAYGWYRFQFSSPFQVGYRMHVTGGGLDTIVDLATLTLEHDLDADALVGQAPPHAGLLANTSGWDFGLYFLDHTTAGPDGNYQIDLSGIVDLHNGRGGRISYPQDDDVDQPGWQSAYDYAPYIDLNESDNGLSGYVPAENVPVTLTLQSSGGAVKGILYTRSSNYGGFAWQQFRDGGNPVDIEPGDRVAVETSGWSQTVTAPQISVLVDPETDRVHGTGPGNSFVEVYVRWASPWLRLPTDSDGRFLADFAGLVDLGPGTEVEVAVYDQHWNRLYAMGRASYARANIAWDAVDGWFGPGVTVAYTVTDQLGTLKGGASGTARPDGWLDGIGCGCDLVPGDRVHVTSGAGFDALLVPISITGRFDVDGDRVTGQMAGGTFPGRGNVWVWSEARQEGSGITLDIAADGTYAADFGGQFDLQAGDLAEVWYTDANLNKVGTALYTLRLHVNYGHNWVYAETESFADVVVNVVGKATLRGQADGDGLFRGWEWESAWVPSRPDIVPGDTVAVSAAGYAAAVDPVGTIHGVVDVEANSVAGTIQAGWFPKTLSVRCEVWVDDGPPGIETSAAPGGGSYLCDFDDVGWDLVPGQTVAVRYREPDGDQVINTFQAGRRIYLPLLMRTYAP